MTVKPAKLTIEQWHKIVDCGVFDRKSVELIEGSIIEMPPEKPIHSGKVLRLCDRLKILLAKEQVIISQGHPITLGNSEPEPDIAILKYREQYYEDRHPIASEVYLVIEIANTSIDFDKSNKKSIYAMAGIAEYWIVDLNTNQLIVHRDPEGMDYKSIEHKKVGEISVVAFPNISLDIEEIVGK